MGKVMVRMLVLVGVLWAGSALAQNPTAIGGTPLSSGALHWSSTAVAAKSLVVLNHPGNVYFAGVTSPSGAGFLMGFDAAVAPSDGTVTPLFCRSVPALTTSEIPVHPGPALRVDNGLVIMYSSGASCFALTGATAFLWGAGQ